MNYLIPAILLGLGGSIHCLGMCGPLVMAMPFHHVTGVNKAIAITVYFLSKATGYAILGMVVGAIGHGLEHLFLQQGLSVFSGIIILLLALFPKISHYLTSHFNLFKMFQPSVLKQSRRSNIAAFMQLGFLNALLPCGLVYTALLVAATTSHYLSAAAFMFVFGISSVCLLVALIIYKTAMQLHYRKQLQVATQYLSIIIGVLLIVRGLGLGIPYISPSYGAASHEALLCH